MARRSRSQGKDPWRPPEEDSLLARLLLWGVARLALPIRCFGIEPGHFRELLRVRVLLSLRPSSAKPSVWGVAGIAVSMLMTTFMGFMTGLVAVFAEDTGLWIVISQSALALLLVLLLFQFLAEVLVDPTDIGVVAPHPVSDRALFAARLSEIFCTLLLFVACFTAGNVCLALFRKPALAVLFVYPLLSLLCGLTTLGAVALLFALCLRVVGATHFQRVTLWAQILGGAVVFGGMQLTRVVHRQQWGLWAEEHHGLLLFWPPYQYGELYTLLTGQGGGPQVLPSLAAVFVPVAAFAVTLRLASRSFVAGLQGTLGSPTPRGGWPTGVLTRVAGFFAPGPERQGFDFATALARREPHFLRTVVPQLVMYQAMSVGMGFGLRRDLSLFIPVSAAFLFLVVPHLLLQVQGTAEPEARAVFLNAPVASEEALMRGALKGLLVQWVGGPALVLFGVQLFVAGLGSLPRIVLAFQLAFVCTLLFLRRYPMALPFTQTIRSAAQGAANFGLFLVSGFAIALIIGVHVLLTSHPLVLGVGIAVLAWWLRALWKGLDRLTIAPQNRLRPTGVSITHA